MSGWAGQSVLVTGGTGFIGSHVVDALLDEQAQVRVLAHYNSTGHLGNLAELDASKRAAFEIHWGDLRDPDSVRRAVKGCSHILHLGALIAIPYSYRDPRHVIDINITGTLNVLTAARDGNVERVVHTSTSEVYGTPDTVPITEGHALKGQSPYAASKIGADKIAESFYCSYSLPVVTVRPFNAYGPRQSLRAVIPTILAQALWAPEIRLGSLWPRRDYTHVQDTAQAFLKAARAPGIDGQVINAGSGRDVSIGELVNLAKVLTGRDIPVITDPNRIRPASSEVHRLLSDSGKARDLLGWEATVPLREGLAETLAYVRDRISPELASNYVM